MKDTFKFNQFTDDPDSGEKGHIYMIIMMSDVIGFVKDLDKIIYGVEFKHLLKRNNDRAIYGADAILNDAIKTIKVISRCVPRINTSNDSNKELSRKH